MSWLRIQQPVSLKSKFALVSYARLFCCCIQQTVSPMTLSKWAFVYHILASYCCCCCCIQQSVSVKTLSKCIVSSQLHFKEVSNDITRFWMLFLLFASAAFKPVSQWQAFLYLILVCCVCGCIQQTVSATTLPEWSFMYLILNCCAALLLHSTGSTILF